MISYVLKTEWKYNGEYIRWKLLEKNSAIIWIYSYKSIKRFRKIDE